MRFTSLTLAATALLPSSTAQAQIAPGLSGSSTTTYTSNPTELWQTLRGFGTCFAGQSEAAAWELIATDPDSKAEAAVYKRMSKGNIKNCLSDTSLRVPVPLVRGAIAEGLYKRGVAVPTELRQEPPPVGTPIRKLSEAARCYAANRRAEAEKLLAETAPGSKEELAALKTMADDFWSCLPDEAQKRTFNPTQIRYRLAEALLRMPQPAGAQEAAK